MEEKILMSKEFQPATDKLKKTEFKNWEIHHQQVETAKQQQLSDTALKEAELQEMREKAYEEGYNQGMEAAQQEVAALKDNLRYWIKIFCHPSEQIEQSIKTEIVDTIFWICKHCIQVELSCHPEALQNIIDEALKALPSLGDSKKLFVNEQDLEWIEAQLLPKDKEIILSVAYQDPSLERGEFYISDEQSELDGRLSTRLDKILRKHLPKNEDADNVPKD